MFKILRRSEGVRWRRRGNRFIRFHLIFLTSRDLGRRFSREKICGLGGAVGCSCRLVSCGSMCTV